MTPSPFSPISLSAASLGASLALPLAFAATQIAAQSQTTGGWQFTITPYLWASGQEGRVGAFENAPDTDVDLSFSDLVENLEFAAMVVGNARNGRWGITADVFYFAAATDGDIAADAFSGYEYDSTLTFVTVVGEYAVVDQPDTTLWLGAGARYWSVTNDLSLNPGAQPGGSFDGDDHWWDPVISVRGTTDLGARTFFTGALFTGGFGAGSESMVDAFAGVGYAFTPTIAGIAGYRYLAVDRDEDDFLYDVRLEGLMLGVRFQL